jgi:tetratricopeptide (TPR) repeat protein
LKGQDRPRSSVRLQRASGGKSYELAHPPCVRERADDLREVQAMLAAGELEVAADELRWLLEDCRDFIEAHKILGELAAAEGDVKLARAHFGFAYDLGCGAIPVTGLDSPLPYELLPNQAFLEAAKGLAWSLIELKQPDKARDVLQRLLACDPTDPLGAGEMLHHPGIEGYNPDDR